MIGMIINLRYSIQIPCIAYTFDKITSWKVHLGPLYLFNFPLSFFPNGTQYSAISTVHVSCTCLMYISTWEKLLIISCQKELQLTCTLGASQVGGRGAHVHQFHDTLGDDIGGCTIRQTMCFGPGSSATYCRSTIKQGRWDPFHMPQAGSLLRWHHRS